MHIWVYWATFANICQGRCLYVEYQIILCWPCTVIVPCRASSNDIFATDETRWSLFADDISKLIFCRYIVVITLNFPRPLHTLNNFCMNIVVSKSRDVGWYDRSAAEAPVISWLHWKSCVDWMGVAFVCLQTTWRWWLPAGSDDTYEHA